MADTKILGIDKDMLIGYVIVFGILAVGVGIIVISANSTRKENLKQTED